MHDRVLVLGVFDLFHVGHLRYLQFARAQARHLAVAVTPDAVCLATKGKAPVINEDQRLEIIRGLGWVDVSSLQPCSTEQTVKAAEWIFQWNVTHVIAGGGWQQSARWARLVPLLEARGIGVSFAPHTEGISTTDILATIQRTQSV